MDLSDTKIRVEKIQANMPCHENAQQNAEKNKEKEFFSLQRTTKGRLLLPETQR